MAGCMTLATCSEITGLMRNPVGFCLSMLDIKTGLGIQAWYSAGARYATWSVAEYRGYVGITSRGTHWV